VAAEPIDPDRLCAFLGEGATYGAPGEQVEHVATHAALIFLVGERSFKMKRRVRYSFLDFSTLARRKQALDAELRLNRRTAPMLYQRVVPVTRSDGALALDGDGEPVEWLLEMARFDQEALLDRIAQRQALEPATIDALAGELATFHDQAERHPEVGGPAAKAAVIEGTSGDLE
jgi:aminoglycoside phosphotransferase family enzyme